MFVCTGNICRSPLAHRVLEHVAEERGIGDTIAVESSGTGGWHIGENADSRMRKTASRHGVVLNHRARRLRRQDVDRYTILFAMARSHYREIERMAPAIGEGTLYLFRQFDPAVMEGGVPLPPREAPDVPDPYYGGPEGFEEVYEMVERTCREIVDRLADGRLP